MAGGAICEQRSATLFVGQLVTQVLTRCHEVTYAMELIDNRKIY